LATAVAAIAQVTCIAQNASHGDSNLKPLEVRVNQPIALTGTLTSGTYDDCCSDGKVRRLTFYAVHLSRPVLFVEPPSLGWGPIVDVQLGSFGELSAGAERLGEHVTVKCARIWDTMTGHYAEHAWCDEAKIIR